jgi:hypothetical protein
MKYLLLIILFFSVIFTAAADTRTLDRTWIGLFGKTSISESVSIWNEVQPRLDNDRVTLQQLMIRPGLLMKFSEKLEGGILYGFIETERLKEHRPTLQLVQTFSNTISGSLSLRNRLEFRQREDLEAQSIRYRGAFRFQHNLDPVKSFIAWEEPFFNLTREDWSGDRLFERNRIFAGMGFKFMKMRLEAGYMNQYTPRQASELIEHILTLYLFY